MHTKQRLLSVFLALTLMFSIAAPALSAGAETNMGMAPEDVFIVAASANGMIGITGLKDPAFKDRITHLVIPSQIGGQRIDSVEVSFAGSESLTSVVIEDGIREITTQCFSRCPNLTTAHLADSLENMATFLFSGCAMLQDCNWPKQAAVIPSGTFSNCTSLRHFAIPEGVTEIGDGAFSGTGLSEIVLPDSLQTAGSDIVHGCALQRLTIGSGLQAAEYSPFFAVEIDTVVVPGSVRQVPARLFDRASVRAVILEQGVETVGDEAFSFCDVETLSIPDSLREIGAGAFEGACLDEIFLPDNVVRVGEEAFAWPETAPKAISIPNTLEKFEWNFLGSCPSGKGIVFRGTLAQLRAIPGNEELDRYQRVTCTDGGLYFGEVQTPEPTQLPEDPPTDVPTRTPDRPAPSELPTVRPTSSPTADASQTPRPTAAPSPLPTGDDPGAVSVGTYPGAPFTMPPQATRIVVEACRSGQKGITMGHLASWIALPPGTALDMRDAHGSVCTGAQMAATGNRILVRDAQGRTVRECTIIAHGDLRGTGRQNLSDLVRLSRAFLGMEPLSGAFFAAGDWNDDGSIGLNDIIRQARALTAAGEGPRFSYGPGQKDPAPWSPAPSVSTAPTATAAPSASTTPTATTAPSASVTPTATAAPSASVTPTVSAAPSGEPTQPDPGESSEPTPSRQPSKAAVSTNRNRHWYDVWSMPVYSYLYPRDDGGYTRVEVIYPEDERIVIENFDADFNFVDAKTLFFTDELPKWGGMYVGKDFNYIVYGQGNPNYSDECEVARVVKYDHDWNRIDSVSIYGANTWAPFVWGSLRCTEYNGYLYVRTCHRMYAEPPDFYQHQANWTFVVRESDMTLTDSYHDIANPSMGYISHSNNQFILVDAEGRLVALDHGDAGTRGPVLVRYLDPAGQEKLWEDEWNAVEYKTLTRFAGSDSMQPTGASIGGFEETSSGYVTAYDYDGIGGTPSRQRRDLYFAYIGKDLSEPRIQKLTNAGWNRTPHVVSTGPDGGYVLWMSSEQSEGTPTTLNYARYDAQGSVGPVRTAQAPLSDCKPICRDGRIVWYTTDESAPVFYVLDEQGVRATPAG